MDEPKDYVVRRDTPKDKTTMPLFIEVGAAVIAVLALVGAVYLALHVGE